MRLGTFRIRNAKILTPSGGTKLVTISVEAGKIRAVSREHGVRHIESDLDVAGKLVLPGLIDCHTHLFALGAEADYADLRGSRSVEEMKSRIKSFIRSRGKPSSLVIGRGWSQDLFVEKRFPNSHDIDEVVSDVPVMMERICGHIAVLNSAAIGELERRGALANQSQELVPLDEDSKPTGIIKEGVLDACWSLLPQLNVHDLETQLLRAQKQALGLGLIGAHCILSDNWRNELAAIRNLDSEDKLLLKLSLLLPISALGVVERTRRREKSRLFQGKRFLVIGFKLFADGSLGARTAALSQDYSDDIGNRGYLYYSDDQVLEYARRVRRLGVVLATHAIGDKAVEQVLKAYKKAGVKKADGFRIEHCSIVRKDLMKDLKSVTLCVQPMFHVSDYWTKDRIGTRNNRIAYPFRSLSRITKLLGSSDTPVESLDPLKGINAAMNNRKGESLTLTESLELYAQNASASSKITVDSGSISKGKACDLIVVSCKDRKGLTNAHVERTFIDAKIVWYSLRQKVPSMRGKLI
jgi:predicted amidohydrolase YtcJ